MGFQGLGGEKLGSLGHTDRIPGETEKAGEVFCTLEPMCPQFFVCLYVCLQMPAASREGVGLLGAEVTGSCELPNMGAGNQTQVLYKNSTCS